MYDDPWKKEKLDATREEVATIDIAAVDPEPSLRETADGPKVPPFVAKALIIDRDRVTKTFIEKLLREGGFTTEVVTTGREALDFLRANLVDLVISDSELGDQRAEQLYRCLQREQRLAQLPFLVLSADARVETKTRYLRSGITDYLVKPIAAAELLARAESLVKARRPVRRRAHPKGVALTGSFSLLSLADLIPILEVKSYSGLLTIRTDRLYGAVYFQYGRGVHATAGNLTGDEALFILLGEATGRFELTPAAADPLRIPTTIVRSNLALLHEWSVRSRSARPTIPPLAPEEIPAAELTPHHRLDPLIRSVEPSLGLAIPIEAEINDAFSLGELELWTTESLRDWTEAKGLRERFHIHVLADLAEGVSFMLPLASPPSEPWVLATLASGEKALGMTFYLRNGRILDAVLIDIHRPEAMAASLRRQPALTIIAPPEGELLSIGPTAERELMRLLVQTAPQLVVGLGQPSLEAELRRLGPIPNPARAPRCLARGLEDGEVDFRVVLVEGIRTWAQSSTDPRMSPRDRSEKLT